MMTMWKHAKRQADFFRFRAHNRRLSQAQLCQDLYVLFKLRNKRNGFFVEFGATNGKEISNTFVLEKNFGWTGILSEPSPIWHSALRKNRNCIIDTRCVWKTSGERLEFLFSASSPELSTLDSFRDCDHHSLARGQSSNTITVETVSLTDLLQEHSAPRIIDYLSVDTEGSEFDILAAFDFTAYTPLILSVEHNYVRSHRERLRSLLESRGYNREFALCSKFDDWYYHRDLA